VFQNILSRKLLLPKHLEGEAADLIDRLLTLDPQNRIGSGPLGSENDFEALKAHPFFKGVNFKKLNQTSPPLPVEV